ncbi:hypothetical protein [uncultured Bacteroides sp.]|uniref:hypothetical protein n=1 Tax=uncultured Bacteroides sp. TaxID=162156 RepID=UPI002635249E|nr:hypothetical protein [uncultured Bacteroides sp.]
MDRQIIISPQLCEDEVVCFIADRYHINPHALLQLFLTQNGIITDTDNVECELQLEDNEIEILRDLTGLDNSN